MKYDIFLSHCRENKINTAVPLYQALSALGFCVWFDREEILTGDTIYDTIKMALYDSSIIVALIADTYLYRSWTQYELNLSLKIEQDHMRGTLKKVFPIYQELDRKTVEKTFPKLKNRAFELLSTDYFNISTREGHMILDRIVLFYFSNCISSTPITNWEWLSQYRSHSYISQLMVLFYACNQVESDLRTCLINYTNAIRYLLAVLNEFESPNNMHHCYSIANRYCIDIANRCFTFHYEITYEMLLSCKSILSVLTGDLKTILDSLQNI